MDATSWEKAKDLIADALELPLSKRDAFLEARCPDPTLLAEVRAMIKDYADAPDFLERLPRFDETDDLDEQEDELDPGSQIGPYVVVDRLGRGGMGQVFLGNDRRLKRKVALKRLLPSRLGQGDERTRILGEARAAASINHPNVATIHDVVEHDMGVFIVMEYVEGESLAARLRRERLPLAHVLAIGRQLASALAAAHAKGVVHRDLKPGNVQLTPGGMAKVLDFGVAKAIGRVSSGSKVSTTASSGVFDVRGVQPGTPEYMSPEQMLGHDVDERSDIFSLGIVLFEMTVGRRPFADLDPVGGVAALGRPAERVDTIDPTVPKELAEVIARALNVDVHERFQSAVELGSALDGVQREVETATAPAGQPAAHRTLAGLALRAAMFVAVTLAILGCFGFINTVAFNYVLQRPGRFSYEPLYMYVVWGFRSNVALFVFAMVAAVVIPALKFLVRVLSLVAPLDRLVRRVTRLRDTAVTRLGLDDPIVLAQGFALIGAALLTALIWRYYDIFNAYTSKITVASPEQLLPLAPENLNEKAPYRIAVNLLLLAFSASVFRIIQLRGRQGVRRGLGAVAIGAALLVLVVLLHEFPYRTMWQNDFERIQVNGELCYLLGEDGGELLAYCPAAGPPRHRIVSRDDPAVRRSGVKESVFTPRKVL